MIPGSQLKGRIAFTHCMHTKKMMYTLHWMRAKVNHSNWSIQIKCNRCVKPKNITQKCKFEHMIHTLALAVVLALVFTLTLSVFFALSGAIASQYNGLFMRKSDSNGLFVNRAIWSTQCAMNDNAPNSTILAIRAETCIWHLPNLRSVRCFFQDGTHSFTLTA